MNVENLSLCVGDKYVLHFVGDRYEGFIIWDDFGQWKLWLVLVEYYQKNITYITNKVLEYNQLIAFTSVGLKYFRLLLIEDDTLFPVQE